jgi:hypothetical protein
MHDHRPGYPRDRPCEADSVAAAGTRLLFALLARLPMSDPFARSSTGAVRI